MQNSPLENSHGSWSVEGLLYSGAIPFVEAEVDNVMQKIALGNIFFPPHPFFPYTNSWPSCFHLIECAYLQMKIAKDTAGLIRM